MSSSDMTHSPEHVARRARSVSGIRSRVLAGLGANASGQILTTIIQLASVPVFLHFWSVEQYGQWLLLSALPAYLALGDLGLGTVAMNRMTMLHARGELAASNVVFQTALLMTTLMAVVLFTLSFLVVWLLPVGLLGPDGARGTMLLLVLGVLLNLYSSLFDAVFRASGQFATGTYLINFARLVEWLGGLIALWRWGSMVAVASGLLAGRLLVMLPLQWFAARRCPAYPWSMRDASRHDLRQMLRPALLFLTFPLGNALTIQGTSVVVGASLGPAALAAFNTYRTLSRLPIQLLTTLSRALWPEISRAYGAGDRTLLRSIYRHGTLLSLVGCGVACLIIFAVARPALGLWTHGSIAFDPLLLALFLLTAFGNCAWQVGQVVLSATNKHEGLAATYILASVLGIGLAAAMPAGWGLPGKALAVGVFELILLIASHRLVRRMLRAA